MPHQLPLGALQTLPIPRPSMATPRFLYCGWTKSISHHLGNPGMMTIPTSNGFPWFQMVRNGFCPPTACFSKPRKPGFLCLQLWLRNQTTTQPAPGETISTSRGVLFWWHWLKLVSFHLQGPSIFPKGHLCQQPRWQCLLCYKVLLRELARCTKNLLPHLHATSLHPRRCLAELGHNNSMVVSFNLR